MCFPFALEVYKSSICSLHEIPLCHLSIVFMQNSKQHSGHLTQKSLVDILKRAEHYGLGQYIKFGWCDNLMFPRKRMYFWYALSEYIFKISLINLSSIEEGQTGHLILVTIPSCTLEFKNLKMQRLQKICQQDSFCIYSLDWLKYISCCY